VLDKFLLIALGGSGEKLARYLEQDVKQRLDRRGWHGAVPDAWRWLCIDVAHASDVITNDVPPTLGSTGKRVGLTRQRLGYAEYHHRLAGDADVLPALVGSLPPPSTELPSPYDGAGQRPQVGHAVGLVELQTLKREIGDQMTRLNAPGVTDELRAVSKLFDAEGEASDPKTMIMIVSSLGGGSGAGLLQVVGELVLNHPQTAHLREDLVSLLFTPDIFSDLTASERAGVQANCIYTISAMLNGYHWTGEQDEGLTGLFDAAGINLRPGRRTTTTNFFVSSGNGAIEFGRQDVAIKATAKALGRWLVDEKMSKSLAAHLEANRNGAPVTDEYRLTRRAEVSRPVSSLGYASISLGDSVLAEYSAERLAKAQLETFLRGHRSQRIPGERDDATVERIAKEKLDWFLEEAGLRGEDILGELFDRKELRDTVQQQVERMQDDIKEGVRRERGSQWRDRIVNQLSEYEERLEEIRETRQREEGERRRERIAARLCATTETSLGRFGAPVTAALLEAARPRVNGTAGELLIKRDERIGPKAKAMDDQGRELLENDRGRSIESGNAVIEDSAKRCGSAVFLRQEAAFHTLAAELLREMPRRVLEPLEACVRKAASELSRSEDRRHRQLVEDWTDGEVPLRLHPAPNQILLEPINEFPLLFDHLVQGTTGEEAPVDAIETAVEEIVTRSWRKTGEDSDRRSAGPIGSVRGWRASSSVPAEFRLRIDAPDLYRGAYEWVVARPGALSERLRLPLARWLEAEPDRPELFVDKFQEALRFAMPLIDVSPAVRQRVHGSPGEPPKLHVNELPVPADSAAAERMTALLEGVGVQQGEARTLFDGTSTTQAVEISSFLSQPVEPVVVKSLLEPVAADWAARKSVSSREQFSSFRRTRPLPLFVPISPDELRRFLRGWILARLFGQLGGPKGRPDQPPICIWSPEGWLRFPPQLLGTDQINGEHDLAGRVLESLPLAMASFANEQYEELNAYMRLLDLGDITGDEIALREWVANGPPSPAFGAGIVAVATTGYDRETPEGHRRKLLEEVARQRGEIQKYLDETPIDRSSVSGLPARWELGRLTLECLDEVQGALIDLAFPPDPDPTPSPVAR
jgi:hypothetical protein